MFSGIIESTGRVSASTPRGQGKLLSIEAPELLDGACDGDSIAVNGVCLTVTGLDKGVFHAEAALESLSKTTLDELKPGSVVNLERAIALGGRMHGHIVQGHVDCVVCAVSMEKRGESVLAGFSLPADFAHLVVERGSVALDGVSLTVASVKGSTFYCSLIGYTLTHTTLKDLGVGAKLNLETDIIGRYVQKMLEKGVRSSGDDGRLDESLLKSWGY